MPPPACDNTASRCIVLWGLAVGPPMRRNVRLIVLLSALDKTDLDGEPTAEKFARKSGTGTVSPVG